MKNRINVRGIIFHDNKLLCVRNTNYRIKKNINYWSVPGGGIDAGESLISGLTREIIEELGIKPVIGKLLFIQQYSDEVYDQLEFFFYIKNSSNFTRIDLSKTSHGIEKIEEVLFLDPTQNNILPKFLTTEKIDVNQSTVKIFSYN
jgi:ADP-ribose pyrophosphatase YjhB (NUDIX family)